VNRNRIDIDSSNRSVRFVRIAIWVVVVSLIVWAAYARYVQGLGWAEWTGFGEYTPPDPNTERAKTLWDVLELLIVPLALALAAWGLNRSEKQTEREIAAEQRKQDLQIEKRRRKQDLEIAAQQRKKDRYIAKERRYDTTLESYFDRMTTLLLDEGLRESEPGDEVRKIARTRTLAVLRRLDGKHRAEVLQFLIDTGLTSGQHFVPPSDEIPPIISLQGAILTSIDLQGAYLRMANLSGADLRKANLRKAYLTGIVLNKADLREADLKEANLRFAVLRGAKLQRADLRGADLQGVDLRGIDLNDTKVYEEDLEKAILEY
jgi:hypothetical protein